jgi:uncharacterized cupin superfamily protein
VYPAGDVAKIEIDRQPSKERLDALGVRGWPIWTKEPSTFPWSYDDPETCYFLDGDVLVTPAGEEAVRVGRGDLVTFPRGMSCTWEVRSAVRKHYRFG